MAKIATNRTYKAVDNAYQELVSNLARNLGIPGQSTQEIIEALQKTHLNPKELTGDAAISLYESFKHGDLERMIIDFIPSNYTQKLYERTNTVYPAVYDEISRMIRHRDLRPDMWGYGNWHRENLERGIRNYVRDKLSTTIKHYNELTVIFDATLLAPEDLEIIPPKLSERFIIWEKKIMYELFGNTNYFGYKFLNINVLEMDMGEYVRSWMMNNQVNQINSESYQQFWAQFDRHARSSTLFHHYFIIRVMLILVRYTAYLLFKSAVKENYSVVYVYSHFNPSFFSSVLQMKGTESYRKQILFPLTNKEIIRWFPLATLGRLVRYDLFHNFNERYYNNLRFMLYFYNDLRAVPEGTKEEPFRVYFYNLPGAKTQTHWREIDRHVRLTPEQLTFMHQEFSADLATKIIKLLIDLPKLLDSLEDYIQVKLKFLEFDLKADLATNLAQTGVEAGIIGSWIEHYQNLMDRGNYQTGKLYILCAPQGAGKSEYTADPSLNAIRLDDEAYDPNQQYTIRLDTDSLSMTNPLYKSHGQVIEQMIQAAGLGDPVLQFTLLVLYKSAVHHQFNKLTYYLLYNILLPGLIEQSASIILETARFHFDKLEALLLRAQEKKYYMKVIMFRSLFSRHYFFNYLRALSIHRFRTYREMKQYYNWSYENITSFLERRGFKDIDFVMLENTFLQTQKGKQHLIMERSGGQFKCYKQKIVSDPEEVKFYELAEKFCSGTLSIVGAAEFSLGLVVVLVILLYVLLCYFLIAEQHVIYMNVLT